MDDLKLLRDAMPEMASIINAEEGRVFSISNADTLLILQRRIKDSDMKRQLGIYNAIFAKQHGALITDITDSAIAFVKIGVLLSENTFDFDPISLRSLIKECHVYIDKTTNIVRLSKTNVLTADDYQKEKIEGTIRKNKCLIEALQAVIDETEKKIERIPKSIDEEEEAEEAVSSESSEEVSQIEKHTIHDRMADISDGIFKLISSGKNKKQIEEKLRDVEKESAETMCAEIPFYEDKLTATEIIDCKDLECFCLLKRKDNVYFGLRKNLSGSIYNNKDQSLMELTKITEDFIQFMSVDLLSDEYVLRPFTKSEKESLRLYFNFVSGCFEKYIGVSLTVAEYLEFKRYYNRLVCKALHLEDEEHKAYYRALPIAELYMAVMDSYNMVYSENKGEIIADIIGDKVLAYTDNLGLIMKHHIVDDSAREEIQILTERFIYFRDESHFEKKESEGNTKDIQVVTNPIPQIPMFPNLMIPQIGNVYFTLQCLNKNMEVVDEAYFSTGNMPQAMEDYKNKEAYLKRFGLVQDGRFVPLLTTEGGCKNEE
ncbi:MAG: hypothetical protein E7222_10600 [Clostridiales bacterium]|nr:hypothetical protein [Clostridiales bacterium]